MSTVSAYASTIAHTGQHIQGCVPCYEYNGTLTVRERFERVCASMWAPTSSPRLGQVTLDALGSEWSPVHIDFSDRNVIDHVSGRVRVEVLDDGFQVEEFDRWGFELGTVFFRGDLTTQGPRALRYATAVAAEVGHTPVRLG